MPTSRRILFILVFLLAKSNPLTTSCPLLILSNPLIVRIKVLLPEPDGPIKTTVSPFSIVKLISVRRGTSHSTFQHYEIRSLT